MQKFYLCLSWTQLQGDSDGKCFYYLTCFVENAFCSGKEEECEDTMKINEKNPGSWNKLTPTHQDRRLDTFNAPLENSSSSKCLLCDLYRGNMNINLHNMMYWWNIKGRVFYKSGSVNWWVIGVTYMKHGWLINRSITEEHNPICMMTLRGWVNGGWVLHSLHTACRQLDCSEFLLPSNHFCKY